MLAQAQEVFWQKGVMGEPESSSHPKRRPTYHLSMPIDRLKNGTISKLALAASNLYSSALAHAQAAKSGAFSFPEVRLA